MSDQFYAVEFQNVQANQHYIAVFSLESEAQWFFRMVDSESQIPEAYEIGKRSLLGYEQIDNLDKPYEAFGLEILYINEWDENGCRIPDVYNY